MNPVTSGCIRLVLGFAAVTLVTTLLVDREAVAQESEIPRDLTDLVDSIRDSVATDPPAGDHEDPDAAPDPNAPATLLFAALQGLDRLFLSREAADLRPPQLRRLETARNETALAFERYGLSDDLGTVIGHIGAGARALQAVAPSPRDPLHATLNRVSEHLALAARGIAHDLLAVGRSAGMRVELISSLEQRMLVADRTLALGQYVAAIGQWGGATNLASNGISFDIGLFEQNLRDALEGQTIGNAYAIVRNGVLYGDMPDGKARTSTDPPETDQSTTKEMYIASISKTISTLALLIALEEANVSVDAAISPYLPESWAQGPNVSAITFRHLMTHRSGLDPGGLSAGSAAGQSLATLEQIIQDGSAGVIDFDDAPYVNANFSLMRVLIPQVTTGQAVIDAYANVLELDLIYAALYAQYVQLKVFTPAGISAPECAPSEAADVRTLYYSVTAPGPGTDWGDWSLACGATGYYLSAIDLAAILAFVRYTDWIIDTQTRQAMDDGFLGWLNPIRFSGMVDGKFGVYRAHGGDIGTGSNPGFTGCMMNYPTVHQAVVLINSRGGNLGGHACTLLRDAYDNAWVAN
jgi:CubicO group peptidase (beta-lactamase class C family)